MADIVETNFIVLRKTPYSESSLIVSSLSLEYGKLEFIIQGARKVSKRSMPVIDLFRLIRGECALRTSGLSKIYSPEIIGNYDMIATMSDNYMQACEIAKFVTANTQPMLEMPMLFSALRNAFESLAATPVELPWPSLVKVVFLYEQGLLPETLGGAESRQAEEEKEQLLASIIEYACSGGDLKVGPAYWPLFRSWIESLCEFNGIRY